ncbi:MAG: aldo/keto reductase, partial [Christensenellales bacterium]
MEVRKLGQSGLVVSRLCFGTLTMGPLQRNFSPSYGAELLAEGFLQGINCLDTAEYYQNYDHIREGLRYKPDAVVITKCHAYDRAGALDSVDKALSGLG